MRTPSHKWKQLSNQKGCGCEIYCHRGCDVSVGVFLKGLVYKMSCIVYQYIQSPGFLFKPLFKAADRRSAGSDVHGHGSDISVSCSL